MKTFFTVVLSLIVLLILIGIVCYAVGAREPVDHTTSVTGTIEAPPAKVFAIITDVAAGPTWRKELKSVKVLPPDNGRDHWIEDLGHGTTMNFLATRTEAPGAGGHAQRDVLLNDPRPSYGGTWTYKLSPGPTSNQTVLQITEAGFIHPPMYRFMMAHFFAMTRNLDAYMSQLQAEAKKS